MTILTLAASTVWLLGVISDSGYGVTDELQGLVPEYEFTPTEESLSGTKFRYRLFVPTDAKPGEKYPVVVWLHGAGEAGRDNTLQMLFMQETIFPDPTNPDRYHFAVLAPQCPRDAGWTGQLGEQCDMLAIVMQMLDEAVAKYPLDPDRVTAVGISAGGSACWELADRYPDRFAAIVPMASSVNTARSIEQIKKVPVWVFFSLGDRTLKSDSVMRMVERLKADGGAAEITFTSDHRNAKMVKLTHFCFVSAFREYGLLEWLLAQSKADTDDPPPGHVLWRSKLSVGYLWPRFGAYFVVVGICVALWAGVKVTRKSNPQAAPLEGGNQDA